MLAPSEPLAKLSFPLQQSYVDPWRLPSSALCSPWRVPPPLLVVGVLAFVMLVMQLVGALMQFLAPVMFPLFLVLNFAPQNLRAPLMLGLVATSLATAFL